MSRTQYQSTILLLRRQLGKAEVNDSELEILVKQAVLGLQISMYDFILMNVMQSTQYHMHDSADFIFRKETFEVL